VWTVPPGTDWADGLVTAVRATVDGGRGVVVVVPDSRDVARVDAALQRTLGAGRHVVLTAELGPQARYRRYLRALLGRVPVVVGTRSAVYAPVVDLGLIAVWDDGDDLLGEPRAPGAHARDVAVLRAHLDASAVLLAGTSRSTAAQRLVEVGWAVALGASRPTVRRSAPRIVTSGTDTALARDAAARSARLPSVAWQVARDALASGPVLVQVPRAGYLLGLACQSCRRPARCARCAGPLAKGVRYAALRCGWCGHVEPAWRCEFCGGTVLRARTVGAERTVEELGRAFPRVLVRASHAGAVLATVGPEPALVVATPGAEPHGSYAAALLLDGDLLLGRADLWAHEEALRRWLAAAALVRPAAAGGTVVVMADAAAPPVQALLRWDPAWFAARELAERRAVGLPPAVRAVDVSGDRTAVEDLLEALRHGVHADLVTAAPEPWPLPVRPAPPAPAAGATAGGTAGAARTADSSSQRGPDAEQVVTVVRVSYGRDVAFAAEVQRHLARRAARKAPDRLRVRFDPVVLP